MIRIPFVSTLQELQVWGGLPREILVACIHPVVAESPKEKNRRRRKSSRARKHDVKSIQLCEIYIFFTHVYDSALIEFHSVRWRNQSVLGRYLLHQWLNNESVRTPLHVYQMTTHVLSFSIRPGLRRVSIVVYQSCSFVNKSPPLWYLFFDENDSASSSCSVSFQQDKLAAESTIQQLLLLLLLPPTGWLASFRFSSPCVMFSFFISIFCGRMEKSFE